MAGGSASLYTHSGGIQAYAANGPVSLQAHTDQLEIVADQAVVVVSVGDAVTIAAKTKIVLQAGKASITLEGGDITFACPGNFTAKGGQHVFDSGGVRRAALSPLPRKLATMPPPDAAVKPPVEYDEQIVYKDKDSVAIAEMPYHVVNQANKEQELVDASPPDGTLARLGTPNAEPLDYALRYANFNFTQPDSGD